MCPKCVLRIFMNCTLPGFHVVSKMVVLSLFWVLVSSGIFCPQTEGGSGFKYYLSKLKLNRKMETA